MSIGNLNPAPCMHISEYNVNPAKLNAQPIAVQIVPLGPNIHVSADFNQATTYISLNPQVPIMWGETNTVKFTIAPASVLRAPASTQSSPPIPANAQTLPVGYLGGPIEPAMTVIPVGTGQAFGCIAASA